MEKQDKTNSNFAQLILNQIEEPTFLEEVRFSKKCYHCDSPNYEDRGDIIICNKCGCEHTEDGYKFTINSLKIESESEGPSGWIPTEGNKGLPKI